MVFMWLHGPRVSLLQMEWHFRKVPAAHFRTSFIRKHLALLVRNGKNQLFLFNDYIHCESKTKLCWKNKSLVSKDNILSLSLQEEIIGRNECLCVNG